MTMYDDLILLVDDDAMQQRILSIFSLQSRFGVHSVQSGEQALKAIAERVSPKEYSLVLLDVMLGKMDGFECARQIRKMEEGTGKRIPIIGMSASPEVDRESCIEAGMDDFMRKPFEIEAFSQAILQWSIVSHTPKYL